MGFDKRENAKTYAPQDGDTLQAIATRETAAGNEITWQDIAKFNWGTDNEEEINEYLRDELGCHKRDDANNFVIASDDEPKGELRIPVLFKKAGLSTEKTHTLHVRKKVSPPQFLDCCEIPGITFAFDKSFVRPSVVDHIKKLEEAVSKHPAAKIMIFGHTDKVGPDDYNKRLSERRAKSVFAFITDNADIWEELYNDPNENWGVEVIQEILTDLGHNPGPIDGIMGDQTRSGMRSFLGLPDGTPVQNDAAFRKKLFTAYMTGKHDIQLTSDQFMDPKHMGCGEFNPVKHTEAAHEPNRRVVFYLFNPERLPKLPCENANLAPCQKQTTPPLPRHKESFKCSFYDSLAKNCTCEVGPTPPTPTPATIEIIDASGNVATSVKMGLWDNAFDASSNVLNNVAEADNFAGADTRRFHFRVKDPAATGSFVTIDWKTLGSTHTALDSAGASLTLVETPAGSKTFVSRGLLLCCDLDDVNQQTNSGLVAPLPDVGNRNRGQSNHRLKTARMDGFVNGEYTPASGAPAVSVELPVFERSPDERRRVPVQIFVLRVAAGGAGVIPTATGTALWTTDIRVIKETYERIGVKLETTTASGTPTTDIVTVDGLSIVLIDPPTGVNPANISFADERTIATAHPSVGGNTLRLFFVGGLASGNGGEAWSDALTTSAGNAMLRATAWTIQSTGPYAAAHEMGHVLTDKRGSVATTGHYTAPTAPAGNRLHDMQNHMKASFLGAESATGAKRLWDANDGDGFNQFTAIRGSRYTRAF